MEHAITIPRPKQEYYRLVEDGKLDEEASVELLDGRIVPMSPVGPDHQQTVRTLYRAFLRQEDGRFETDQDSPLPIPDHDEPRPDVLLYRPGAANRHHHATPADVLLGEYGFSLNNVCERAMALLA